MKFFFKFFYEINTLITNAENNTLTLCRINSGEGTGVCSVTVIIGFGEVSKTHSRRVSPIYLATYFL